MKTFVCRKWKFFKNCNKNDLAPSEQFLTLVDCAVITLLQEFDKTHDSRANKKPCRQIHGYRIISDNNNYFNIRLLCQ